MLDTHMRWCSCGLMVAGTDIQIARQCEAHWLTSDCPWRLLDHDPRKPA